jgi:hypothetical protein
MEETSSSDESAERLLQSLAVVGKNDAILLDLWELQFELFRSYQSYAATVIRPYLNTERMYYYRVNPVNKSITNEWYKNETLDKTIALNNNENLVFHLNPNEYMLVTMDLRHILDSYWNWVYGEDWDISITISTAPFDVNDPVVNVLMPELYLNSKQPRSQVTEFEILAWNSIWVRIDVLIYNSLYLNHKYVF